MTITGQVITSAGSTIRTATVTGNISNKGVTTTDSRSPRSGLGWI